MITENDLILIKENPSIETKNVVAIKVCDYYQKEGISENAISIAESIFMIMLNDAEKKVRETLAKALKDSKKLPREIVKKLIDDIDSVSIPFIADYKHFSDMDITEILTTDRLDQHVAVALRKNVSFEISDYIVKNCHSRVVEALISNIDAKILDETFDVILKKYKQDEKIKESLVLRPELPASFIDKLIQFLSQELLKKLVALRALPENTASNIVEEIKEKSILKISEDLSTDEQILSLAKELYDNNRLSPSLILRAICMGDMRFFEYAIMFLSQSKITEVRKVFSGEGQDYMTRNLLRKASIPKEMFAPIISAVNIIKEIKISMNKPQKKVLSHRVAERLLSLSIANEEISEKDVKYLISRIN